MDLRTRLFTSLFAAPAMHSQQEVGERAAHVIERVVFDLGVGRLVQGSVALDARLRPRFFSAEPCAGVQACVPLAALAEAAFLDAPPAAGGEPALREPLAALVEGLLREFRLQSPRFRDLPAHA